MEGSPDLRRCQWHVGVADLDGVEYRVHHGRRRTDRRRFTDALHAERMVRRRSDGLAELPRRAFHRRRQQVVHERPAEVVAILVEGDHLHQCHADTVCQTTMHLTLDDHRVDSWAAVVDSDEAADLDLAGAGVDIGDADVGTEWIGEVGRVVHALAVEVSLDPVGKFQRAVRQHGDLLDRLAFLRVALDLPASELPLEVVGRALERGSGNDAGLVAHTPGHDRRGPAADRCRSRAVGAEAERGVVGVALNDFDILGWNAQLLGDDLGEGRLMPLALRDTAEPQLCLAGRVHSQLCAVGHAEPEDVHVLARTCADAFGEERDANAHHGLAGVAGRTSFAPARLLGA